MLNSIINVIIPDNMLFVNVLGGRFHKNKATSARCVFCLAIDTDICYNVFIA